MWVGPRLKFASSRVKVEDAAAMLIENWGGDHWGHTVYCSSMDYWSQPRSASQTRYTIFPAFDKLFARVCDGPLEQTVASGFEHYSLCPHDAVPEGEVWLVPARYLRSL